MYSTISFISNIYYPLAFVFLSMGASLLTTSLLMICFWLSFACYIGKEMTTTMIMMMVIGYIAARLRWSVRSAWRCRGRPRCPAAATATSSAAPALRRATLIPVPRAR